MLTKPKYQLYSVRVYFHPDGKVNMILWATDKGTAIKQATKFFNYDKPVCHTYKKYESFYKTVEKISAFGKWIDRNDHNYHDLVGWY